jgi:uncharacterized lipoprotein YmbA
VIIEQIYRNRAALIVLACTILLSACGRSPMVKFYTLSPTPVGTTGSSDLALLVGPAEFPRALNRSQIVTRTSDTQFQVNEFHVWSAPLDFDFLRVVSDNIATALKSDRIVTYPAEPPYKVDYRVLLDVLQFDGSLGQSVVLRVRWTIMQSAGDAVAVGTFNNTQTIAEDDDSYDALVAAHSAAVGELSRTLVAEVNRLGKPVL